jgi:hypothetical protein
MVVTASFGLHPLVSIKRSVSLEQVDSVGASAEAIPLLLRLLLHNHNSTAQSWALKPNT